MTTKYTPPSFRTDAFNCPHCGAYAHQKWAHFIADMSQGGPGINPKINK